MSTTNALAILGDGYSITITPEAEAYKNKVVGLAREIVAVTDDFTCERAQKGVKALAAIRTGVESSRVAVKAPVIALGKTIDGIAKDFAADVMTEEARLSGLVADYAREQQRKAREAAEAAERERQRIAREKHEQEMKALREQQEAERKRMEAERAEHEAEMAKLKAARELDADATEEAERKANEARRQQAEAERAAQAARDAEERARKEAADREAAVNTQVAPAMPAGVKEDVDFEVIDIVLFAQKFPQLVTITPKRADILAAIKKSLAAKGKLPEVAGLRVFSNLKVRTR